MARGLEFEDENKKVAHAALDFDAMATEVADAQELCDSTHSPVVFCHNDLLSGNFLLLGGSSDRSVEDMADLKVQLIDFEYGCYSFRGFDWGVQHLLLEGHAAYRSVNCDFILLQRQNLCVPTTGNHFNEWAGFDCEWEHFPTQAQQETFLRAYLETGSVRSVSPEQVRHHAPLNAWAARLPAPAVNRPRCHMSC